MKSSTFYAVVVAMTCIILQEASCNKKLGHVNRPKKNEKGLQQSSGLNNPVVDCENFKSKIWDRAFSSPGAMDLVDKTLESAKKMDTDEVCSDTIRAYINFINVIGVNEHAFYSMRMLYKVIETIVREIDTSSRGFIEMQKLFNKMISIPALRQLTLTTFDRTMKMMTDDVTRKRLFNMLITVMAGGQPVQSPATGSG